MIRHYIAGSQRPEVLQRLVPDRALVPLDVNQSSVKVYRKGLEQGLLSLMRGAIRLGHIRQLGNLVSAIEDDKNSILLPHYMSLSPPVQLMCQMERWRQQIVPYCPFRLNEHNLKPCRVTSGATVFVVSSNCRDLLERRGFDPCNIVVCGSPFYHHASSILGGPKDFEPTGKGQICLVSQVLSEWIGRKAPLRIQREFAAIKLMLAHLRRFIHEGYARSVLVALRPQALGDIGSAMEQNFFRRHLSGVDISFSPSSSDGLSSLAAGLKSDVMLALHSNVGLDGIALGGRAVFCSYGLLHQVMPPAEASEFTINQATYEEFRRVVFEVMTASSASWRSMSSTLILRNCAPDLDGWESFLSLAKLR